MRFLFRYLNTKLPYYPKVIPTSESGVIETEFRSVVAAPTSYKPLASQRVLLYLRK